MAGPATSPAGLEPSYESPPRMARVAATPRWSGVMSAAERAAPAPFEAEAPDGPEAETLFESASLAEANPLILALGSYEGPLDMLLDLARRQKVDLREISILALAEQYLSFIAEAKRLRLELAADYLVMAAWLAYLKSRLLLPKPPEDEEPTGEEMAAHLAFQLERLQAMRDVAEALFARAQLGRDFFARGEPEKRRISTRVEWTASQVELFRAYVRQSTKKSFQPLHYERRSVVAIDEALLRLRRALANAPDWETLESYLPSEWLDEEYARSAIASTFAAALELAKHGQVVLKQEEAFAPLYIAPRDGAAPLSESALAAALSRPEPAPTDERADASASPREEASEDEASEDEASADEASAEERRERLRDEAQTRGDAA
ncbi:MAG: ScpA family protein [Pseudomonadota bacterium]